MSENLLEEKIEEKNYIYYIKGSKTASRRQKSNEVAKLKNAFDVHLTAHFSTPPTLGLKQPITGKSTKALIESVYQLRSGKGQSNDKN